MDRQTPKRRPAPRAPRRPIVVNNAPAELQPAPPSRRAAEPEPLLWEELLGQLGGAA